MNLQDAPIRTKLILLITMTSAVVLFLTSAAFVAYQIFSSRRALLSNSRTIAQITAAQSSAAVFFDDEKVSEEILSKLRAEPTILQAALYTRDGRMLARYPTNLEVSNFPPMPMSREFAIHDKTLDLLVPVMEKNQNVGALYLKWDLSLVYQRLRWDAYMTGVVLVCSLVLAVAISAWLQRRISKPILELSETAQKVASSHDYGARARIYSHDEFGLLTEAFNEMLGRIGAQDEALRKNEEQLRKALKSTEAAAAEVRQLNAELEDRVANRTAELAAANRELEAFAYSVSHDLRAPLRHIDAFAQILGDELQSNPEKIPHYLARIRSGAQNMGRLVDDLLKLSRVGTVALKPERVPLDEVVKEVVADVKMDVAGRDIEWRIAPLPSAKCDRGLITQVFTNLISNAVKYTRGRKPAIIEIGLETVNGERAIFVRDNGVGFDMKFSPQLFGVFQRLHRAEDFEGTGIGLATVQRIVRLHGGKIWANAALDKGATFHFTLPGLEAAV